MARSQGYRAVNANREEADAIRKELGETQDWVKAQGLMTRLVEVLGKRGPTGVGVSPRACRACGYYGHTKQWCPRVAAKEDKEIERELKREAEERRRRARERAREKEAQGKKSAVQLFEELGWEWKMHPSGIGAFPAWYVDELEAKRTYAKSA